jgi:hypothetical protein
MSKTILALSVSLVVLAGLAFADVRTEMLTRISMPAGMGNMEGTTVTEYQGDKRNETGTMKFVGGIVGAFAGGPQNQAEITRLDKEVIWDLDHKAKAYTEKPLTAAEKPMKGVDVKSERSGEPPDQHYRITKSEVKVVKTGAEKTINTFPCKEYVITYDMVIEDSATKKTIEQVMTMDMWATPLTDALKAAQAAQTEFNQKLAKKTGMELSPDEAQQLGMGSLTAAYGLDSRATAEKMAEVSAEMDKIEGYPIVTDLKWQMKGDSLAEAQPEPAEEEEPSPSATGVPSLGSMLGKALGNKIASKPTQSEPGVLFTSYFELKSVTTSDIAADHFEVPAGYKKVQEK